jgi:hypothetical protein
MASSKPSLIARPAPAYQISGTKTTSITSNNTSSTTRGHSTSHRWATPSTMAKSPTSTSQWAMGFIKRPSGFISMMMEWCWGITAPRGPTNNPASSIYMPCLTLASTPPSRHFQPGSDICSLAPAGTSRSCSKQWPTPTTGAWPKKSHAITNLTTISQRSPSRLSSISVTSTLYEHGLAHVSPASCSPTPLNGSPHCKMCQGSWEQYILGGRGVVAHRAACMYIPRH